MGLHTVGMRLRLKVSRKKRQKKKEGLVKLMTHESTTSMDKR